MARKSGPLLGTILASMELRGIGYAALARLGRLMEDTEIVFRQGARKHGKPNLKASYLGKRRKKEYLESEGCGVTNKYLAEGRYAYLSQIALKDCDESWRLPRFNGGL
ncbi:hypothetical protein C8J57DRAFT_1255510 [Mycena rebaudengoi]|nr:hypothetical protein C8J57DRAFT_1255510 [Mycena rebaudengoi]